MSLSENSDSRRDCPIPDCDGFTRLSAERDDLRQVGDYMQSEASRLAEWANEQRNDMPYEVHQAFLGVQHAVLRWTEVRKGSR